MSGPHDPFEERVARDLERLAGSARPPADLADRAGVLASRRHRARQRRVLAAVGASLVGVVAAVALIVGPGDGDDHRDVRTRDDRPATSTTSLESTSTAVDSTIGESGETTTTVAVTTTSQAVDPAPEPACTGEVAGAGATRPPEDDWPAYWQTMPEPDQPISMRVCVDDITPSVGQTITITLAADDPDAPFVEREVCSVILRVESGPEEDPQDYLDCISPVPRPPQPLPTPAPSPGHLERTMSGTYPRAGTWPLRVFALSGEVLRPSPYQSGAYAEIIITVHD